MNTDAYKEGLAAGENDFHSFWNTPNPYAYGSQAHDDFERGWQDGHDNTLDETDWRW